jgi:hypothetical protein
MIGKEQIESIYEAHVQGVWYLETNKAMNAGSTQLLNPENQIITLPFIKEEPFRVVYSITFSCQYRPSVSLRPAVAIWTYPFSHRGEGGGADVHSMCLGNDVTCHLHIQHQLRENAGAVDTPGSGLRPAGFSGFTRWFPYS